MEDLTVALADKLWKGKRGDALEAKALELLSQCLDREPWELFQERDSEFEALAARGPERVFLTQGAA